MGVDAHVHRVHRHTGNLVEVSAQLLVDLVLPLGLRVEEKRCENRVAALLGGHCVDVVLHSHSVEHVLDVFVWPFPSHVPSDSEDTQFAVFYLRNGFVCPTPPRWSCEVTFKLPACCSVDGYVRLDLVGPSSIATINNDRFFSF